MKHYLIYIYTSILVFASCTNEIIPTCGDGSAVLDITSLTRAGASSAMAIDEDLAITILDSDEEIFRQYPAGKIPGKIVLKPGTFTLQAYTENQNTWNEENNGLGAACYFGSIQIKVTDDEIKKIEMEVPISNYAVTLTLPDLFDKLFKSYSFTLSSGTRSVNIKEGDKAYFPVEEGGFTYKLSATNSDNNSHSTTPITYRNVEAGKLYNMTYYYGTDANSGGLDIEITDDMETEDEDIPL